MNLRDWDNQPQQLDLVAIYTGCESGFSRFVRGWLSLRGKADLRAFRIKDTKMRPPQQHQDAGHLSVAVFMDELPSYFMIHYFMDQAGWRLMYRPRGEDTVSGPGPGQGLYYPWGKVPGPDAATVGHDLDNLKNGAPVDHTVWFMDQHGVVPLVLTGSGREFNHEPRQIPFPLRLVNEYPRKENNSDEVSIIEDEIASLKERLDNLRWWSACEARPVRLYLYEEREPYGPGSHMALVNWVLRAPEEVQGKYWHQRVSLGEDGPSFHLVIPRDFKPGSMDTLPEPTCRLVLDRFWRAKGRYLFTPEGQQLWPPPPGDNGLTVQKMERCLWEKKRLTDPLIIFTLQKRSDAPESGGEAGPRTVRFLAHRDAFAPLPEQVQSLNIKLVTEIEHQACHRQRKIFGELSGAMEHQVATELQVELKQMAQDLDALWAGDHADLDAYRASVQKCLDRARQVTDGQKTLKESLYNLEKADWSQWDEFRIEVERLDRDMELKKQ